MISFSFKRVLFILIYLNCFQNDLSAQVKRISDLKTYTLEPKKTELFKILRNFVTETKPARMVGTLAHKKASDFILKKIEKFDTEKSGALAIQEFIPDIVSAQEMYRLDFQEKIIPHFSPASKEYLKWKNFTDYMVLFLEKYKEIKGKNIIWQRNIDGIKSTLVVTAHYDTISHDKETHRVLEKSEMPGADYNASGVTIALALIEKLSKIDLKKNIRVVFLDYSTLGFLGAKAYAKTILEEQEQNKLLIEGVINLEMLGHDSKQFDKTKKYKNMKAYISAPNINHYKEEQAFAKQLIALGQRNRYGVNFELMANGFQNSDNYIFSKEGIPAVTFSQNWEDDFNDKNYQTANDFPETLNQDTFYESYRFISTAVIAWLLKLEK